VTLVLRLGLKQHYSSIAQEKGRLFVTKDKVFAQSVAVFDHKNLLPKTTIFLFNVEQYKIL